MDLQTTVLLCLACFGLGAFFSSVMHKRTLIKALEEVDDHALEQLRKQGLTEAFVEGNFRLQRSLEELENDETP